MDRGTHPAEYASTLFRPTALDGSPLRKPESVHSEAFQAGGRRSVPRQRSKKRAYVIRAVGRNSRYSGVFRRTGVSAFGAIRGHAIAPSYLRVSQRSQPGWSFAESGTTGGMEPPVFRRAAYGLRLKPGGPGLARILRNGGLGYRQPANCGFYFGCAFLLRSTSKLNTRHSLLSANRPDQSIDDAEIGAGEPR